MLTTDEWTRAQRMQPVEAAEVLADAASREAESLRALAEHAPNAHLAAVWTVGAIQLEKMRDRLRQTQRACGDDPPSGAVVALSAYPALCAHGVGVGVGQICAECQP